MTELSVLAWYTVKKICEIGKKTVLSFWCANLKYCWPRAFIIFCRKIFLQKLFNPVVEFSPFPETAHEARADFMLQNRWWLVYYIHAGEAKQVAASNTSKNPICMFSNTCYSVFLNLTRGFFDKIVFLSKTIVFPV